MRDGTPYCIRGPEYFAPYAEAFNDHFRFVAPSLPVEPGGVLGPVCWARFGDIEYNVDFNRPLHIASSIGIAIFDPVDKGVHVLALHRSEERAPFGEKDRRLLACVSSIVAPFYSLWREADQAMKLDVPRCSSRAKGAQLSKREWEVATLLCRRLTLRQIAGRLSLSTRTVESHVGHIYLKLGVSNRRQLVSMLLAGEPITGGPAPMEAS